MSSAKFYKYLRINRNLYNTIINGELFFSNPRVFNDPFDSYPRLKTTKDKKLAHNLFDLLKKYINSEEEFVKRSNGFEKLNTTLNTILKYWNSHMSFDLYTPSNESRDNKLIELFTFYNHDNIYDKLLELDSISLQNKMFQDFLFLMIDFKNYGILCGSSTPSCPVMWGHYADNHRGVCLEFELLDEEGNDSFCFSKDDNYDIGIVEYTDEPIDILNLPLKKVAEIDKKLLTTKSKRWSYENEVRLITRKQGLFKFKRNSLVSAIFGCKSTRKDRYSVCALLKNMGYKSPYLIAKMQPDIYEMKIDQMILNDVAGAGFHWEELNL